MEPKKSMTRYAIFVCAVAALRAASDGAVPVALAGVGLLLLGGILDVGYRLSIRRRDDALADRPPRRHRDRWARAQWISTGTFCLVVGAAFAWLSAPTFHWGVSREADFVNAALTAATVGSVAVLASALVDWFWVLPRVAGLVRLAPCEAAGREKWERTTGIWLWHRAVATLVVAGVIVGVPAYMGDTAGSGGGGRAAWFVAAATLGAAVASFVNAGGRALWLAFRPTTLLGDAVDVHGRNCLVVDVSLQGAKYLLMNRLPRTAFDAKEDGSFALDDFGRYPDLAGRTSPCAGGCVKANWYCRLNREHGDGVDADFSPAPPARAAAPTPRGTRRAT
jgi:hypothetical protein